MVAGSATVTKVVPLDTVTSKNFPLDANFSLQRGLYSRLIGGGGVTGEVTSGMLTGDDRLVGVVGGDCGDVVESGLTGGRG